MRYSSFIPHTHCLALNYLRNLIYCNIKASNIQLYCISLYEIFIDAIGRDCTD